MSDRGNILFLDLVNSSIEGKGSARAMIAHAMNTHSDLNEIHLVNMSKHPDRERSRKLYDDCAIPICLDPLRRAYLPNGSRISIDIKTEEYRIGLRPQLLLSQRWEPPMIVPWLPDGWSASAIPLRR